MIIKIIPENDQERNMVQEVEHTGVKEFFIFGNKKDNDGDILDFHDWHGSYRFLLGSLAYFTSVISQERSEKESSDSKLRVMPRVVPGRTEGGPSMIKYGANENQQLVSPDGTPLRNVSNVIEMNEQPQEIIDEMMNQDDTDPEMIEAMDDFEEQKPKKSKGKQ